MAEITFDWDQWNVQKNELKHGVSQLEAESAFYDPRHRLFEDEKHSTPREPRYILYGRGLESRVLRAPLPFSGRGYRACRGSHPLRLPMPSRYASPFALAN